MFLKMQKSVFLCVVCALYDVSLFSVHDYLIQESIFCVYTVYLVTDMMRLYWQWIRKMSHLNKYKILEN